MTLPASVAAQVPQTDTLPKRDSASVADSIAIVRELEGLRPPPADTAADRARPPANARLLPDISVVGDFIADLSPKRSTQEGGARFGVREVELALQAAVDPYFRGDVFIGFSDEEGAAVEQAYLTATAIPGLEARFGRFLMPFGKQLTTHRHDLHTIEYPYVIQRFFGPEGLKGTGAYVSRVFSPLGFYQELIGTVVDRFGEAPEQLTADGSPNDKIGGLGYSARLRNYWDLSEASNVEISFSGITGKKEQPLSSGFAGTNAINARQSVIATDVTYRWRPLQQGIYKSFIAQAELMRQSNETPVVPDEYEEADGRPIEFAGPRGRYTGGYVFARYQTSRRTFVGARYDFLEDPERDGANTTAASGYFTFFPSEFSKIVAGYQRYIPRGGDKSLNRLIVQATFALGPHKPHPF